MIKRKETITMRYEVGDKVKVKSWDKMVAQYGLDEDGWVDVDGSVSFIPEMKKYCGKTVTIKEVNPEESYYFIEGDDYCVYSEGMFE